MTAFTEPTEPTGHAESSATAAPATASRADIARRRALRRDALCDPRRRQELYQSHPVVCNALRVVTLPVRQVYEGIVQTIVHRMPGSPIVGDFRMGKTRTITLVREALKIPFPKLPVALLIAKQHDKPTERAFFGDLLSDYRHGGALSGSAAERRLRLLTLIAGAANSVGSDLYVIFIDEGQNWDIQEFVWMRDVVNDLQELGVDCIVIVFAHTELKLLRDKVIARKRTDLLGRFFLTPREFRGLRDVAELTHTMTAFDDPALHDYPVGSDLCMTEFFLPLAYEAGWRLANEAPTLWAAFEFVAARRGRTAGNIGMQWVMASLRTMLFEGTALDRPGFQYDLESWVKAVESSEYESSLQ